MAGYAPPDATTSASRPTILPSLVRPNLAVIVKSRPWTRETMSSDLVSIHFTGRPSCWAAAAAIKYSTYTAAFGPNPPPTHGHTTRTCSGFSPSTADRAGCTEWGAWCEIQQVMPPAGSPGTMRQPFGSMGTPASRWLTMVTSATASAPTSGSSSAPKAVPKHTLDPCSGKSSGASGASAAFWDTTAGNGSMSTTTVSAASTPCSAVSATMAATI